MDLIVGVKGKGKSKGPTPPPALAGPPGTSRSERLSFKLKVGDGSLSSAPYTIVTALNGTRTKVLADGTSMILPKDWVDSNAQFCVPSPQGEAVEPPKKSTLESLPALRDLMSEKPELAYLVQAYLDGIPMKALESRLRGQHGAQAWEAFLVAIGGLEAEPEVVSELQGSLEAMHGRLGDASWPAPLLTVKCLAIARPGYNSGAAHEYLDADEVLRAKAAVLAGLIRQARHLVVYAGAGLSTASGIMDYATRTGKDSILAKDASVSKPQPQTPYAARPNLGHRVLAAMSSAGLIWRFIQQNHDGLPQKAGMAQSVMNEIHGGWFDPSNPVVTMQGSLREDLFMDLMECERKADLVLVVGSSLCGMNADRLVSTCARRALRSVPSDPILGSAIVGLQQTPHDDTSSVRIFATIDRTMELVAEALCLEVPPPEVTPPQPSEDHRPLGPDIDVFDVPYDETGKLSPAGLRRQLDLREGAKLVVTVGQSEGNDAVVLGKNADGHYRIGVKSSATECEGDWTDMRLMGCWWVTAAVAGDVSRLPVVSPAAP